MKLQHFILQLLKKQIHLLSKISKRKAGKKAFAIFCTPLGKSKYKITAILNQAESVKYVIDGLTIRGYRWNKGAGKKLLIAHGFRSHTQRFEHFVPLLIHKGYEVMAFDAPAHGLSDGKRVTAIDYARLIRLLNEEYGRFNAYLAHSFGGMAVCLAISEMPGNENIKIVLVAPASNTQGLINQFLDQFEITDVLVKKHFYENIEQLSNKELNWYTIERTLQTLKSKILWLHDRLDRITPIGDAYQIQQMNPTNIEFVFTEGLGHSKIYRDEKMITKIIDFL